MRFGWSDFVTLAGGVVACVVLGFLLVGLHGTPAATVIGGLLSMVAIMLAVLIYLRQLSQSGKQHGEVEAMFQTLPAGLAKRIRPLINGLQVTQSGKSLKPDDMAVVTDLMRRYGEDTAIKDVTILDPRHAPLSYIADIVAEWRKSSDAPNGRWTVENLVCIVQKRGQGNFATFFLFRNTRDELVVYQVAPGGRGKKGEQVKVTLVTSAGA